jgi:hypothetical protein
MRRFLFKLLHLAILQRWGHCVFPFVAAFSILKKRQPNSLAVCSLTLGTKIAGTTATAAATAAATAPTATAFKAVCQ